MAVIAAFRLADFQSLKSLEIRIVSILLQSRVLHTQTQTHYPLQEPLLRDIVTRGLIAYQIACRRVFLRVLLCGTQEVIPNHTLRVSKSLNWPDFPGTEMWARVLLCALSSRRHFCRQLHEEGPSCIGF